MKMRTYAEADRDRHDNGRRFAAPIYGDPNLGYWNEGPRPTNDVPDTDYKTVWPEGYWELYADLQKAALEISDAIVVHMVMLQNGKFRVYALMPAGVSLGGPMWGPEESDRNLAWKSFIRGFTPKSKMRKA